MTNEFSVGDYIDVKFSAQDWCVGRIIERDADIFKIRLDGMLARNDLRLRYNSNRIAPFRKYSRGYTGNIKAYRDDPSLEFDKIEEVANLIEVFLRKNYSEFDPILLTYNLRGRIFLFTDALLSKPGDDLNFDEIRDCFKYLSKLLGFAVIYLRGYPKLFAQFNEGLRNPDTLVTKNDVIFSHFIFELMESLSGIFGLMQRCSRLYDTRIDMNELTELLNSYQESISITTPVDLTTKTDDSSENKQDPDASNQMSSEEIPVENIKTILANLMVNKFGAIGGFTALFNIIYPEATAVNGEERDEDTATESEASPVKRPNSAEKTSLDTSVTSDNAMKVEKISKTYCPWIIIERILRLFEFLNPRLEEEYKLQILIELKQRVSDRMKSIKDREIKELDIDVVKKVLDRLENLVTSLNNSQQSTDFYEFRERNELELYFRFLDGQSFEKKLRGLNGIREYASRVDIGSSQMDDAKAARKTLIYFTPKEFVKWVLEKKVIEMIYEKYPHIELIKRSVDIQKFVAEYGETFPENLIDKIWNSSRDKHEDVVKAIYEKIIELGPYMGLEAAQLMYSKFLTVRVDDYNEDFIELISKFTQKCLRLVMAKTESGYLEINEIPETQRKYQFFGIPLMFELILDETSLDTYLSQRVLVYLQEIISEFPAWNIFLTIINECLNNIMQDISVYQSLFIMKEFLTTVEKVPAYEALCERYFEKLAENHPIIDYLVKSISLYWEKVRERIRVLKNVTKKDIKEEEIVDECLVGKFSHQKNIMERLSALRYFVAHSYLKNLLTPDQVRSLWKVFVLEPNFNFETTAFLKLISTLYPVSRQRSTMLVSLQDLKEVLLEILCNENMSIISQFTLDKFNCLEFYFVCVNMYEKKIMQQDKDGELVISSDYMLTIDRNLTGLNFLWKCLVECPDGLLVDKFITLLVNIHTKLGPDLKEHAQELYQELVANIMSSIEKLLEQRNIKAIERYIQFLGKFFDKLANKRSSEFYRSTFGPMGNPNSIHAAHFQSQMQKIPIVAEYYPYGNTNKYEFYKKDKVGWIKESLARFFDIDSSDFELTIDDVLITEDDLIKELKDVIQIQGPGALSAKMNKKDPRPLTEDPKYLITQNREYINILFRLFATIEPEKLKTIWDFTQKLPIQEDMKREFFERRDFSDILDGEKALNNANVFKLHYYLTIISDLYIADPYYLKIKHIDYNTVKSEWSSIFVNGNGVASLITLITSTDFSHINNFLWTKALLILYKVLRFFFITYPETQELISSEVFLKNLDVLFYASQYIGTSLGGDITLIYEVVRDHGHMCQTLCEIQQRMLKADQRFYRDFLEYPNLRDLFMIVFINPSLEKCDLYEPQIAFINLLNDVIEVLRTSQSAGKEIGNNLFRIVFEEMIFTALRSQYIAYYILKFIADTLSKYDLKKHFDCDLNIFNLMKDLVEYIKNQETNTNNLQDIKEEACFYILQQYLQMNPSKIQYFGQDLGLVREILAKGIFQVPSLDRKQGPKYTSKNVVKKAFDMLSNLSRNEKNFETIVDYLMPIHRMGIWRNFKVSSWSLSANIKRRSYQYAGLKNLGCTCYMNSTLQQLFMIPTFRKYLPQLIDPTFNSEEADDNILYQLKRLFYGMTHVDKEYFSPKKFCLAFKDIDGSSTSFNEQKDAFEFFSLFMDRIEEQIKGTPHSDFIKSHFGGLFSNELICKECPHSYDREEPFLAINLPVKNKKTITDSLGSFIEGEILDGDNAYYCEECKTKVKTVKRVSIKKLPNYLIFVLKRFEYDFDMNARVKVNDYCEFPLELNMEPFTQQYLKKMERPRKSTNDSMAIEISNTKTMGEFTKASSEYDLKGVVIHLGIADSGHYYSVIKDTKTTEDGTKKDVWLEFNDTKVFEFNAKGLGDVGFGEKDGQHSYQSAYILVYERKNLDADLKKMEEEFVKYADLVNIAREQEVVEIEKNGDNDLIEEKPVVSGDSDKMDVEKHEGAKKDENAKDDDPKKFIKKIREEEEKFQEIEDELIRKNLRIFYITNIFSADYTKFISNLITNYEQLAASGVSDYGTTNAEGNNGMENEGDDTLIEEEDAVRRNKGHGRIHDELFKFVCVVYFTTIIRVNDKKLQHSFFEWMCEKMDRDVRKCELVLNYFMNINFFTEMIFQCPHQEQRKFFVNLVKRAFKRVYENEKIHKIFNKHTEDGEQASCAANFLNFIINFLEKSKLYLKTMPEFYWLFLVLMKIDEDVVNYLLTNQLLGRLGAIFCPNALEQEEVDEVMETLPYYETEIDIDYNEDITMEPKKPKENDFYKHSLSDLTNFFSLMWELLTYSFVSDREDHRNFPYYRPGIEYELSAIESKIYNLKKDQIEEMFYAISFENAKARRTICKIIAHSSYNSLQNSRASLKYIQEELKEDKTNRRTDEYFKLISVLAKLDDAWAKRRNDILTDNVITALASKTDNIQSVNIFARFISRLIKSNVQVANVFRETTLKCDKVIKALRECISKQNQMAMPDQTARPTNYQVLEQTKKIIQRHIDFFDALKDNEQPEERPNSDPGSEELEEYKYRRGQRIEFFDSTVNKWLKGVVENVYENMVKLKTTHPNGNIYYEWIEDDSSYLHSAEEPVTQEVNPNPEDTSPTQYCSSGDISFNQIDSPPSDRSREEMII